MVKNSHSHKIKVAKMRILQWVYGHTTRDRVRNEDILDKVRETRLIWFKHMMKRCSDASMRYERSDMVVLRRGRSRLK